MNLFNTPILFIIFNRLETTKKVFETIRLLQPGTLFVAADGARQEKVGETEKCNDVRNYVLSHIDWDCDVKTLFQDTNLGCGYGPKAAITWFFEHVEEGIILEDDCVPDMTFYNYCSELLEKYRYDDRISIISGSNMDREGRYSNQHADYFFSVIPYTWGWATWRRNWEKYDYEIKKWNKINKTKLLRGLHPNIENQLYWKKIFDDIYKITPNDIWDYQFFFSCFTQNQLAIIPSRNLVSNIGHDIGATHTVDINSIQANVPKYSMIFPLVHPDEIKRNVEYDVFLQDACYGKVEYVSVMKHIKRYVKKILNVNK
jgi:hypothetical protein